MSNSEPDPPEDPAATQADVAVMIRDVAAMLRVMRPVKSGTSPKDVLERRRMVADLCKFIGVKLGTVPPAALGFPINIDGTTIEGGEHSPNVIPAKLPPRLLQTLRCLLEGDSEEQVARRLQLSPHTVHVYVKSLYRRFNVSSRAELMSRHVRKD